MVSHEICPENQVKEVLESATEGERFAFDRVLEMVHGAIEIRREAGTEGMPAGFSGNVDGVTFNVYIGSEQKEEQ